MADESENEEDWDSGEQGEVEGDDRTPTQELCLNGPIPKKVIGVDQMLARFCSIRNKPKKRKLLIPAKKTQELIKTEAKLASSGSENESEKSSQDQESEFES